MMMIMVVIMIIKILLENIAVNVRYGDDCKSNDNKISMAYFCFTMGPLHHGGAQNMLDGNDTHMTTLRHQHSTASGV